MKSFILDTFLNIRIIVSPYHWFGLYRISKTWDQEIRKMLENPEFQYISSRRVKLNGTTIWISNYPYAFGDKHERDLHALESFELLPSRKTRIRLKKAVDKFLTEVPKRDLYKSRRLYTSISF